MNRIFLLSLLLVFTTCHGFLSHPASATEPRTVTLDEAPSPPDNPLKGLVPYASPREDPFPHSLEFNYLPMGALMVGPDAYDWTRLERLLDEVSSRGHQTIFRIFLEYPGQDQGIPQFLLDEGLKVNVWRRDPEGPFTRRLVVRTPDYEDPNLRRALQNFIAAMGERYDGDPRIGFITAGLLGTWGEWHTYPHSEWFASKAAQREVIDAYRDAFSTTPILLRYPAGPDDYAYAPTFREPFGYHDDSFAWATLETGRRDDNWFYMAKLREAGRSALDRWKTHPIGGEIRPELWGVIFDKDPGVPQAQDFLECVETTHATWLMDTGMFREEPSETRYQRAVAMVRRLGYDFHVPSLTYEIEDSEDGAIRLDVNVENRGIAPFYYDWSIEYALLDNDGAVVRTIVGEGQLTGLLPDQSRVWTDRIPLSDLEGGRYTIALRAVNPLANGILLRFANATQDADLDGWLTLTDVTIAGASR